MTAEEILRRIELDVDAELLRAASSIDPAQPVPPETEAYQVRLRSLHDSVISMEAYEAGLLVHNPEDSTPEA